MTNHDDTQQAWSENHASNHGCHAAGNHVPRSPYKGESGERREATRVMSLREVSFSTDRVESRLDYDVLSRVNTEKTCGRPQTDDVDGDPPLQPLCRQCVRDLPADASGLCQFCKVVAP